MANIIDLSQYTVVDLNPASPSFLLMVMMAVIAIAIIAVIVLAVIICMKKCKKNAVNQVPKGSSVAVKTTASGKKRATVRRKVAK